MNVKIFGLAAALLSVTAGGAYEFGYQRGFEQGEETGYDHGANAAIFKVSVDLENESLGCARSGAPDCSNYVIIRDWLRGYMETHANSSDWVRL